MSEEVRLCPPTDRKCILCERVEEWDGETSNWEIREINGKEMVGEKFCMHEWDITGTHKSIIEVV
ncbi:MAG TPA: hypothetical protein HA275_00335 [Halobacteriales archaeon]|uniref:HEWD family protein n=1 Tax=Candidatus Hikarchaeum yamanae TaxID=2675326 RepID=UPI001832CDD1|nr:hypothetical protein [Halobacteriales archaeon]|tara:strand:- start:6372 stop:6566 length:195 start_codon:yes stop_codon:yes gene_type:complete